VPSISSSQRLNTEAMLQVGLTLSEGPGRFAPSALFEWPLVMAYLWLITITDVLGRERPACPPY
jgi:hypothetical protein